MQVAPHLVVQKAVSACMVMRTQVGTAWWTWRSRHPHEPQAGNKVNRAAPEARQSGADCQMQA